MGSGSHPPFWVVLLVQIVSVVGDTFGQRAARKDFKGSTRRMLLALTSVSCLQVFVLLGIMQAAMPVSITGAIYNSGSTALPCYQEVDMDGHLPSYCDSGSGHNCTQIDCPAQGPFSIARSFRLHPLLWLNGIINIAYYVGEVALYGEPLGVVLIVMAALASSFVITPLESAMGMVDSPTPPGIVLLGLIGSVACVVERKATASDLTLTFTQLYRRFWTATKRRLCGVCCKPNAADDDETRLLPNSAASPATVAGAGDNVVRVGAGAVPQSPEHDKRSPGSRGSGNSQGPAPVTNDTLLGLNQPAVAAGGADGNNKPADAQAEAAAVSTGVWGVLKTTVRVALPFTLLAVAYSMWFVTQKLFNNDYRTNAFGYTSLDQTLAPVYMLLYWTCVELIPPLRRTFVPEEDRHESLIQAVKGAVKDGVANNGRGFATLFFYRLLTNSRAVAYFYLSVMFDLNVVYLELTLIRIVLSWLASLLVCGFFPHFIDMTTQERYTVFSPLNILLKTAGTILIVVALLLLN